MIQDSKELFPSCTLLRGRACGQVLLVFLPFIHTDIQVALLLADGEVFPTVHRERKHPRLLFKNESRAVALWDAKRGFIPN